LVFHPGSSTGQALTKQRNATLEDKNKMKRKLNASGVMEITEAEVNTSEMDMAGLTSKAN
jgi:hypothetical protein